MEKSEFQIEKESFLKLCEQMYFGHKIKLTTDCNVKPLDDENLFIQSIDEDHKFTIINQQNVIIGIVNQNDILIN